MIRTHLTDEELPWLEDIRNPPRFDAVVLGDEKLLRLSFYGGETSIGWDGSDEEA